MKIKFFTQRSIILATSFLALFQFSSGQVKNNTSDTPLKLASSILLPAVSGRIDHMTFDRKRQYIYVAALGNNSVEVVDLRKNIVVHSIKGLKEPQGVLSIPDNNTIFITSGFNGECSFFNADSFERIKSIKLSGDADNARYDSISKRIYVGYGEGGIAVIDAVNLKLLKEINLSEHPESFQLDKTAKKIYVNVPSQNQIEIIELDKGQATGRWKVTEAASNFPLSLDENNHRLFVGCRRPAKLLVVDSENGKTVASFITDSDADDLFYDKKSKQIYLSCGSGVVDIFQQLNADDYKPLGKVSTFSGARTSLFIPELNQLVVASPSGFNRKASLLIYNLNKD